MMLPKSNKKPDRLFNIAVAVMLMLTAWSFVTYRQRMLFVDPAWITFNIVNHHAFVFAEHRFGAFITQMIPLMGVSFGWSLRTILLLYSASFYLFYLSTVLILGLVLKQKPLSLLLVVYLTLFVSDGYYWPNNEVHQGIAWMLLFIGMNRYQFRHKISSFSGYLLSVVFLVLAISCHLLVALPILFLWYYVHRETPVKALLRNGKFVLTSILILLLLLGKYQLSRHGWYDASKLESIERLSFEKLTGIFHSGQLASFGRLAVRNYWLSLIIFGGSAYYLIRSKRYLALLVWLLGIMAYMTLVCLIFPGGYGRSMRFYMESEWAALAIILAAPLVFDFCIPDPENIVALILVTVFGIRLAYILCAFSYFDSRFRRLVRLVDTLQSKNIHKAVIVEKQQQSEGNFIMAWGLPVESMMLSEIQGYPVQTTLKIMADRPEILMNATDSIYAPFDKKPAAVLNRQYFHLDTMQRYRVLSAEDCRKMGLR
ncbi:MAG TPA: hypothetical protein VFL76_06815 [Edaphocola sp.]|nr:hypothetical protein [Edaphocola sp.]